MAPVVRAHAAAASLPKLVAYRNPGCGCCEMWVRHLRRAGFDASMSDDPDLASRQSSLGVPEALRGCHTAVLGQYVVEGHVPASDILRLWKEQPDVKGLAVPGMPADSPGMETLGPSDKFDVVLFRADGTTESYKSY